MCTRRYGDGLQLQAELLDAVSNLVAVDAEELRRLALVASGTLDGLGQPLTLDVLEVDALCRQTELRGFNASSERREIRRFEPVAIDQQHRPLDRVAQLADVAGPLVLLERRRGSFRESAHMLPEFAIETIDVETGEQRDVASPLAERRKRNRHDLQPVEQVFA